MRVLHIVRQYAPSVGGLESFVAQLAQSLAHHGCESEILTLDHAFSSRPFCRLPPQERVAGVDVHRVPMIGNRRFFVPMMSNRNLEKYDVVHVHGIDGMFERIARYPRRKGQICIATSHGLFFHTPWMAHLKRTYFRNVTRLAAGRYDCLIANSASDEAHLRSLGPPIVQIANGITPLGDFRASGHDLLCLGRLASHKRIDRVIAMMAAAPLAHTALHIVGPAWDVPVHALAEQAAAAGVADRVHIHGAVSSKRLAEIARGCGVFVSASEYEGFGMSLIEAMSVGLIPVVQPNDSFQQLLNAADIGSLVSFDAPLQAATCAAKAIACLTDESRAQAIDFAASYTWSNHAAATAKLYESLLLAAA